MGVWLYSTLIRKATRYDEVVLAVRLFLLVMPEVGLGG